MSEPDIHGTLGTTRAVPLSISKDETAPPP